MEIGFFLDAILSFFTTDEAVITFGEKALQIIGICYVFYGISLVMMAALIGAGDTKTPTIINYVCFWLIQDPLSCWLAKGLDMGPVVAFIAIPIAEAIIAKYAFWVFKKGHWKNVKM